jgi:hypothetical protein
MKADDIITLAVTVLPMIAYVVYRWDQLDNTPYEDQ